MATNKKSFVLYTDIIESIRLLDDTKAGELFKHILSYVNDENPTTNDVIINLVFTPIKLQLKRDLKRYETRAERSRENGTKGGRPKTQKTQQVNLKPRKPDTDTVTVTDTVNDNKIYIPTIQEFLNHATTKLAYQNKDAQYYNHALTSKYNTWLDDDWKNAHGKKIKNWKNALNNTLPYLKPIYPDKKSIPFTTKKHIPKAPEPRKKVAVTIDDLTSGNLAEQKRAWEQKIQEANNNQSKRVSRAETLRQAHNS
mgnify:CR=1 FL=1|tara:strand:+ start:2015 stop:2776 length:762 start_codon:yes stop_codon:yes gene_type:complete